MVQTRLHKHSLSKKEQAVSGVASRASVRDPIDEFQDVYGSRAASAAFRQQLGSDFSRSPQIQPLIQAKPSFRGLSQELAAESQPVQLREEENKTGLPDDLKAGVENLSGYSLDDVRVHYNSPEPAQLQALAYTQGTEIHVGPGQEKHLAHEAWHVVQQMQGRVKPTMQMKGVQINENKGLENEADVMGAKMIIQRAFIPRDDLTSVKKIGSHLPIQAMMKSSKVQQAEKALEETKENLKSLRDKEDLKAEVAASDFLHPISGVLDKVGTGGDYEDAKLLVNHYQDEQKARNEVTKCEVELEKVKKEENEQSSASSTEDSSSCSIM